jgi:AraC-like DNA-binding protein
MGNRTAIRAFLVPLFLGYARSKRADVDALLRRHELSPDLEFRPDVEIEVEQLNALFDALASELGDPFLGIHVAVQYQRGTYHVFEFACRNSPNLRGAVLRMVRYASLLNQAVAFSFTEVGQTGALTHRLEGLGRQANEFTIAVIYLLARELGREAWTPEAVWFAHAAPSDTGELASLFGTKRIRFGEDSNGMLVGTDVLDTPVVGADPTLLRALETEMGRQVSQPARATSSQLASETARAVKATLELGAPRIENIAQSLGTSVRTLQRRLDDEGTSFQKVVEQTRERLARELVERGELSSPQLAFALGYADVVSFLRAFRRWTQTTPQEFRAGKGAR